MKIYFKSKKEAQKYTQELYNKMFPQGNQQYLQWLSSYIEELTNFHQSYTRKILQKYFQPVDEKQLYQYIVQDQYPNEFTEKQKASITDHFHNRLILEEQDWFQQWWKKQPFKYKRIWKLYLDGHPWKSIQRRVSETDHKKITRIFDRMIKEIQRLAHQEE